jgi:hypothetical protein
VEKVEDAARTIARAIYGPPARDLATTRNGAIGYALMRHIPRRWLDAILRRRLARLAAAGHFDGSPLMRLASRP